MQTTARTPRAEVGSRGQAILATTPEEAARYTHTLARCSRDGEWLSIAQLLDMKDFPTDKITPFYCESVSLTEFLIRTIGNERNFTIFLRDSQRYGTSRPFAASTTSTVRKPSKVPGNAPRWKQDDNRHPCHPQAATLPLPDLAT